MTNRPTPTTAPHAGETSVRLLGRPTSWVAFVSINDDTETRIRFRDIAHPARYRCDACGRSTGPTCIHARLAVAVGPILRGQPA